MRFVDTNILLYAVSTDAKGAVEMRIARGLLEAEDLALSVQVLQEFYVQASRPTRTGSLSHDQAVALDEAFLRFPAQELTVLVMRAAMETSKRFQISYWDASVIEAARAIGCRTLLSEDLADGRDYGGVRVESPFRSPTKRPRTS